MPDRARTPRSQAPPTGTGQRETPISRLLVQPRRGDQESIEDHHDPHPRPQRGDRKGQRKGRHRMAGGEARIGLGAREMGKVEGIGMAADERPAAAHGVFHEFADQDREQDREEQKL